MVDKLLGYSAALLSVLGIHRQSLAALVSSSIELGNIRFSTIVRSLQEDANIRIHSV